MQTTCSGVASNKASSRCIFSYKEKEMRSVVQRDDSNFSEMMLHVIGQIARMQEEYGIKLRGLLGWGNMTITIPPFSTNVSDGVMMTCTRKRIRAKRRK